jgi:hypothetical protein
MVLATQHFPLLASFPGLRPPNSDFVVLMAIGLMAASIRVGWRRRLVLTGVTLCATFGLQTLAAVATISLESAQEMERSQRILVLLPVEFQLVNQAKLTLYHAQLAVIFLLFLLTSPWMRELDVGGRLERRRGRRGAVGLAVLVALAVSWIAWGRWRETDARHVAAHAKIGHLFWVKRDDRIAEEQYRLAIQGSTVDPEVYFNVAGLAALRGHPEEATRLLRRCAELGTGPVWRARVARAFERIATRQAATSNSLPPRRVGFER